MLPLNMKKYLAARKRASAILMAAALATFTVVGPPVAEAQNAPEKIQLMAAALRARDSGDLTLAKNKTEELIKIAPNDSNVQRLLASINKDLDRSAASGAVFGQAFGNGFPQTAATTGPRNNRCFSFEAHYNFSVVIKTRSDVMS